MLIYLLASIACSWLIVLTQIDNKTFLITKTTPDTEPVPTITPVTDYTRFGGNSRLTEPTGGSNTETTWTGTDGTTTSSSNTKRDTSLVSTLPSLTKTQSFGFTVSTNMTEEAGFIVSTTVTEVSSSTSMSGFTVGTVTEVSYRNSSNLLPFETQVIHGTVTNLIAAAEINSTTTNNGVLTSYPASSILERTMVVASATKSPVTVLASDTQTLPVSGSVSPNIPKPSFTTVYSFSQSNLLISHTAPETVSSHSPLATPDSAGRRNHIINTQISPTNVSTSDCKNSTDIRLVYIYSSFTILMYCCHCCI